MGRVNALFITTNQYDLCGSANITRNADGIPIESKEYPAAKPDLSSLGDVQVMTELPKAKDNDSLHSLHIAGLETHCILMDEIAGLESFAGDLGAKVTSLYSSAKFAAGETFKYLDNGFNKITRALFASYGNNKQSLYVLKRDLSRNGMKEEFTFSSSLASQLTSTGQPADFIRDTSDLLKATESLKSHCTEVNGYLESLLAEIKKISSLKSNQAALDLIGKYESLSKPVWKLPNHPTASVSVSDVLPGGKVFKFEHKDGNTVRYSMSGDKPSGETQQDPFNQSEYDQAIKNLASVNELISYLSRQMKIYLSVIKRWGDAVKSATAALDHESEISATVKRKLEHLMDGPEDYLLFYSGFLPKVVSYLNRVVQDSIGLSGKLIN